MCLRFKIDSHYRSSILNFLKKSKSQCAVVWKDCVGCEYNYYFCKNSMAIVNNKSTLSNHPSKYEVRRWSVLSSSPILYNESQRKRFLACLDNSEYLFFAINSLSKRILIRRQLSIYLLTALYFARRQPSLILLHFYYALHC